MSIDGFMTLVNKLHYTIDLVRDDEKTYSYVENCLNVLENRISSQIPPPKLIDTHEQNKQTAQMQIPMGGQQSIFSGFFAQTPQSDLFMEMATSKTASQDSYKRMTESPAYKYLSNYFGDHMETTQLVLIAELLSPRLKIPLYKDDKRKKRTIIAWFNKNWDTLLPEMQKLPLHEIKSI